MRWLYKIWSGYDGFRPSRIEARIGRSGGLSLGWAKYADAAEPGDEVWVWFFEGRSFVPGVYVKGVVESIDPIAHELVLRAQEWSATQTLTTPAENTTLARVVAPRNRQVFVLPDEFRRFDDCTATLPGAVSCAARKCDFCTYWARLPLIKKSQLNTPALLSADVLAFAPAYWVVATRSFAWNLSGRVRLGVQRSTQMFYRFKTGEAALAYPLARGIVTTLAQRRLIDADAIVPIPLSPEKIAANEIHRTRLLSNAVGALIKVPIIEALHLKFPIGKRSAQQAGRSFSQFRKEYAGALSVARRDLAGLGRILLVDDVCTYGNTIAAAIECLRDSGVVAEIIVATAGQMTVRDAVGDDRAVLVSAAT